MNASYSSVGASGTFLMIRSVAPHAGVSISNASDGSAVRSFLYVPDAAAAVVAVLERGEAGSVYNIDSGIPVSIGDLARAIRERMGGALNLVFDADKPTGVPYRVGSMDRLASIGYRPPTTLANGLAATIADFQSRKANGTL